MFPTERLARTRDTLQLLFFAAALLALCTTAAAESTRPNILIAIADDWSWPHASAYGSRFVSTPAFDRLSQEGILFRNAFAASPGCSPSRAALLTGRHPWQIEQAGTHASSFPKKYPTFPDLLEEAGYFVGMTGKGWGPGNWKISGRTRNPAGPAFTKHKLNPPHRAISNNDYAANFKDFLAARPKDQPFYFWYGASEPHRAYEKGIGLAAGKRLEQAEVPPFLPDSPEVRSDLLDYAVEVEWFDTHLGRMLELLKEAGELDNTIVIATADNGMPFPRAKANLYEYGFHVPLAIRWGDKVRSGQTTDHLVGFVDITATIVEAAGVQVPSDVPRHAGHSFLELLLSGERNQNSADKDPAVYAARERHSSSRFNNWTYPQRAIRTPEFLYIRNFRPERWPAGDPVLLKEDGTSAGPHSGYKDIDGCPTLDFLITHRDEFGRYLNLAVAKRPPEELFAIQQDPGCLKNLAQDPDFREIRVRLANQLTQHLSETGDPRVLDGGEIWETYPRYSPIRKFPAP